MTEEKSKFRESLDFVVRHYRENSFIPKPLAMVGFRRPWYRRPAAAAAAVAVVLAASACAIYFVNTVQSVPATVEPAVQTAVSPLVETALPASPTTSLRIEFDDASLADVVKHIEQTWDVKIGNLPKEDYRLTLSYEGNAADLIETINELLNIDLRIK
ncbi:MAG: DUF4974 domain-containing protein [Clostridium sp.]|nr:DUF4974 domain-containing protein [Clostridium sp.]